MDVIDRVQATAIPDLYHKLLELHLAADRSAVDAGVSRQLLELVRLRVSQLNGCAFCVDLHSTAAVEAGETARRLHALTVWRGVPFFDSRERAALALAEAMTRLPVPDDVYAAAAAEFTSAELACLMWTVSVVGAFNRLGVAGRLAPA
ncbi:carboxymuconolactone decarboxylase family protein [Actinokineospora sp. HUAS TT18]|uniref:carboxymuconolactone decarboxylase family protein n=1 Tax=Actinokineospora sp. HUAS TT18 TaxID=3447451 RepID=UPI003F51CF9D